MKTENKHKYYNDEDEINFEKLNNFRKFNSTLKNNVQSNNHIIININAGNCLTIPVLYSIMVT